MNDLLQSMALAGAGQWSGSTDHLEAPEDPVSASGSQRMKELAYSTTAINYTTLSNRHKLKNKGRAGDVLSFLHPEVLFVESSLKATVSGR